VIRAIVFDFDGVIADSEPLHLRALQGVLAPLGMSVGREEYYARYLGYDDVGAFQAIGRDRGVDLSETDVRGLIAAKSTIYQTLLTGDGVLFAGAAQCVEGLASVFPLGIASGALRHEIQAILRTGGLDQHFRFIVASGDTPTGKPAPDPYLKAAALHGFEPSECVAIEDSRWGIESARSAGMHCVGITHSYPASELAGADVIVDRLDQFTAELIGTL
jgi:beta-phosphoglucomutase-like phosphatase (HAD superfamily)